MSGQTKPETALQSLAEKLRTDAIAIFGEGRSERDIIEWFYGALLAAAPSTPAAQGAVPEGWALVPARMELLPEDIAVIMFHCGGDDDATEVDERFQGGVLWVGETLDDDGSKSYGLNIACVECLEEGSTPVVEFSPPAMLDSAPTVKAEQVQCEFHGDDSSACEKYSGNVPCEPVPANPAERQDQGEVQGLSAWIACCDDQLPPEDQQVLCWCDDGGMTFFEVASQHNGFFTDCFHELLPVTHWMPFPAAPALAAGTAQQSALLASAAKQGEGVKDE